MALAPLFIAAFNNDPQVIAFGTAQAPYSYIVLFPPLLFPLCRGNFKGRRKINGSHAGHAGMLVCHTNYIYYCRPSYFIQDIRVIFWAYPLTWALSSVIFMIYFLKGSWMQGFNKN